VRGDRPAALAGTLLVVLFAALVWLAHHPAHPLLARASGWPLVGPAARAFRDHFTPRPIAPPPGPGDDSAPVVLTLEVPEPERVDPSHSPPALPRAARAAPDRTVEPPRPLDSTPVSSARLARVRELLGAGRFEGRLGPYRYLGARPAPRRWDAVAARIDDAFRTRTGLRPRGAPRETVALFADRGRYRELLAGEPLLAGLDPDGHALPGMAAVVAPDPDDPVAEAVLVHELAHLVSRRAIGPALPGWLAEGLAEDLAWSAFEPEGGFDFGRLRPGVVRTGKSIHLDGAAAALERLARALDAGGLPALRELVAEDAGAPPAVPTPLRYSESLWLVRYLYALEAGAPFRAFLSEVAAGGDAGAHGLERALGRELDDLEPGFESFVRGRKRVEVDEAVERLKLPGERIVPFQEDEGASGSSSRQTEPPSP